MVDVKMSDFKEAVELFSKEKYGVSVKDLKENNGNSCVDFVAHLLLLACGDEINLRDDITHGCGYIFNEAYFNEPKEEPLEP